MTKVSTQKLFNKSLKLFLSHPVMYLFGLDSFVYSKHVKAAFRKMHFPLRLFSAFLLGKTTLHYEKRSWNALRQ